VGPTHRLVGAPLMSMCNSVPVPGVCMYSRGIPYLAHTSCRPSVGGAVPRNVGEVERR